VCLKHYSPFSIERDLIIEIIKIRHEKVSRADDPAWLTNKRGDYHKDGTKFSNFFLRCCSSSRRRSDPQTAEVLEVGHATGVEITEDIGIGSTVDTKLVVVKTASSPVQRLNKDSSDRRYQHTFDLYQNWKSSAIKNKGGSALILVGSSHAVKESLT
jgi:hypothetical protein